MHLSSKLFVVGLCFSVIATVVACGGEIEDIKRDPQHFGLVTDPFPPGAKPLSNNEFDAHYKAGALKLVNSKFQLEEFPGGRYIFADWDNEYSSNAQVEHEFIDRTGKKRKVLLLSPELQNQISATAERQFNDLQNQTQLYKTFYRSIEPSLLKLKSLPTPEKFNVLSINERVNTLRVIGTLARTAPLASVSSPPPAPAPVPASSNPIRSCSDDIGFGNDLDHASINPKPLVKGCEVLEEGGIVKNLEYPLKNYVSCVKDQGGRGTCWAFAVTSTMETAVSVKSGQFLNLSEQHLISSVKLYWWPGMIEDSAGADIFWRASKEQYTWLLENKWEYNVSAYRSYDPKVRRFYDTCAGYPGECSDSVHQAQMYCTDRTEHRDCGFMQISNSDKNDTAQRKITSWVELWNSKDPDASLDLAIAALRMRKPLSIGYTVTPSFDAGGGNGWSVWNADSRNEKVRGGHASHLVGYISNTELLQALPNAAQAPGGGYFIVKNSWGPCAGDAGYYYVPREYFKYRANSIQAINAIE